MDDWYRIWFSNKFYLELYSHRDEAEAKHIIDLIQRTLKNPPGHKVLDICCGSGRHAIEFAKRGYDVTGVDLSKPLLEKAKSIVRKIPDVGVKIKFLVKDMRNFNFHKSFDIAINIFTSFGYFKDDSENFKLFENALSSLKKNGYLVFDYFNVHYLTKNIVSESYDKINNRVILQKRTIRGEFLIKEIYITHLKKQYIFKEIIKLYSPELLKKIIKNTGFKIVNLFGDYYGNNFHNQQSERLIIIAKKH